MSLFIEPDIVDAGRRRAAISRLREMKVTLLTPPISPGRLRRISPG
jgi:hypothetical protein